MAVVEILSIARFYDRLSYCGHTEEVSGNTWFTESSSLQQLFLKLMQKFLDDRSDISEFFPRLATQKLPIGKDSATIWWAEVKFIEGEVPGLRLFKATVSIGVEDGSSREEVIVSSNIDDLLTAIVIN